MKKTTLFLISFLSCSILLYSNDLAKDYQKLIASYDVPNFVTESKSHKEFWDGIVSNNEDFVEFFYAVVNKKGDAREAQLRINKDYYEMELYLRSLHTVDGDSLSHWLIDDLGAKQVSLNAKISLVYDDDANAFVVPDGRIYINTGLMDLEDMDYKMLLGVCAHEFAHFVLQHAYVGTYKTVKKEKKNNTIAAITAGVNILSSGYAAANGIEQDWDAVGKGVDNLIESAKKDAEKYKYKYNREQEIEADIIAYRFLDWIGAGGEAYIDCLRLLQKNNIFDWYQSEDSKHPATEYRIGLLSYLDRNKEAIQNISKLYDAMKNQGFDKLGSLDDFSKRLQKEKNRKKTFEELFKRGFSNLGTFEEFSNKVVFVD
ncbi:hypothetical protein M2138_001516 [Dysgonomonadaceae bacterium PH5-43]|nr:hypothetical protein [Dysgonomonadaceae bacterium PH5-43]